MEYEDTSQNSLLGGDMNEDTQNEGSIELNISKTALHDPIASDQLPIDSLFQEVKCRLSANSSCNNMNYGENMLPAFATINHGQTLEVTDNKGEPDFDDNVTDNKREPDSDDDVTDNKGEPDADDNVTDNKEELDSDDSVTDNKGEPDSDDNVTDNKGELDSDDNVTDNKGEPDFGDNVTDNKGEPDSDDNVTDNKGEPDSVDNVTDNKGEQDSNDNVTDNKGEQDSDDNVTDNKGGLDSDDNVTDNKGDPNSDDNVTDNKRELDSDDNFTDTCTKGEPDSDDNVQLLPTFDKIIEDNVDIELHENISDNLIHPTHTFDDLSNVLNAADQKTEICYGLCTCSDASVDSILPAFDKMKYNPEINYLNYNNEFDLDNDSYIDEPLSTGRSIEKCELGNRRSNGYSNCIKDYSLITSDAIDSHSIYDHSNLEQFKTNPVSECAFNTVDNLHSMTDTCTCNENIEMELVMEEMVEFPVPCDKILQENHAGETEIGATDCERLSVIPQNVIEKQSKTEDLKFECDVTQTVNFSDDTNLVETEVDNNRDGKLESEDPADDMCMKGAGAAVCTSTQDMTDTESVTDEAAEYLSEKESCFVVLGTLLVIMCIELYSSSSKHIRARETDLLESSDDLGLNLLFEEGNEGKYINSATSWENLSLEVYD